MLRILKLLVLGVLMIGIILLSLANRGDVTLNVMPEGLQQIVPLSYDVPLFLVILVSILVGLLIGYILEWLREHKHRRTASEAQRKARKLSNEVDTLKRKSMSEEEELLAILEQKPGNA